MHFKDIFPCIFLLALFFLDVSYAEFRGNAIKHNKLSCFLLPDRVFSIFSV